MNKLAATILIPTILLLAGVVSATPVEIKNPDFDLPNGTVYGLTTDPDWVQLQGDFGSGANAGFYDNTLFLGTQSGSHQAAVVTQLLNYLISDGDQFELTFDLWSWEAGTGVRAELYYLDALTATVMPDALTAPAFASDEFTSSLGGRANPETFTLTFDAALPVGAVGQNVGIRLTAINTTDKPDQYTDLDDFTLDVVQGHAPEPATMGLLVIGATALLKRRRK
jgi:hypothetical protein